ncbi:hypothetical protein [Azospirillum aestuarii]|uniref:hypothetical protein n=1 Tax=Azospirillum aestuarii TaxID=2802052 RepID=UPI004054A36B
MSRDLPVNLQDHEVRALLDGRKTQHRFPITNMRVARTPETRPYTLRGGHLAKALDQADGFRCVHEDIWTWTASALEHQRPAVHTMWLAHLGYSAGQRLWARECWSEPTDQFVIYRANWREDAEARGIDNIPADDRGVRWRSSAVMPRWASRLTLVVERVRVLRLQEVTREDAHVEGAITDEWLQWREDAANIGMPEGSSIEDERDVFAHLWDGRHGAKPGQRWKDNPYIVALTFRVHRANIDKLEVTHA